MKNLFSKIFILLIVGLFVSAPNVYAQSCDTLKEIFENSDYCDKKEVSIRGRVYELLNQSTIAETNYAYAFQLTDDGEYIIKVVSPDSLFFIKNDELIVNGKYYKNYQNIVSLGVDIRVILTGEEYSDLLINYVGRNIIKNENLQRKILSLSIVAPFLILGAFYFGFIFYKRRRFKGISFEGYIEDLFRKNKEWKVEQDNSYRKLRKGWVESYGNPDFVFIHRRTNKKIAVECKYKGKEYERIFWAYEDQIERYQNFSQKQNIPVFVILGIGGRPKNPKRVFLVPLGQIKYCDVKIDYLEKFERDPKKYFSFDSRDGLI